MTAVVAPRGRGTSALLDLAARLAAERGFRVLRAAGHADERDLPGAGLHQLLRPAPGADLRDAARAALGRDGPVLVVVDDLHLIDDFTAGVLRESLTGPLLAGVPAHRAAGVLPPGATVITLDRLTEDEAATLLARLPGVPRGRARLEMLRRARGNPRAIVELAAAFPGEDDILRLTPARTLPVRDRYAAQLSALPAGVLRLARQVSARLGDENLATVLGAVPGSDDHLAAALDCGLLERHGEQLCFAEPLAAIATYTSCPATDRAELHRRFAAMLPPGSLPYVRHLAAAATEPSEPLAAMLEQGARRAPHADQAAALQRAAELSLSPADAARRYAAALTAASLIGQTGWVHELYTALLEQDVPGALRAATVATAAQMKSRTGRQREAMDVLADGVHRLGLPGMPPLTGPDALLLASAAAQITQVSALPEHRAALADLVQRLDLPEPALLRRAIEVTLDPYRPWPMTTAGDHDQTPGDDLTLAYLAEAAGDSTTAVRHRERALARLRRNGGIVAAPEMWLPLLMGLGDQGRYSEAMTLIAEVRRCCAITDLPLLELEIDAVGSLISALRGDVTRARALAEPPWARAYLHENRRLHYFLSMTVGVAAFTEGDFAAAYQHYRRLFGDDGRTLYPDSGGHALLGLTVIAPRADRRDDAARVLPAYDEPATTRMRLLVEHARAELLGGEPAEERYRTAVADPAAATWALDHALARLHYGVWLRRQRRPLDAREQLSAALLALEQFGASALAAIARGEVKATGAIDDEALDGRDVLRALSPQQRTIVALAARGLRNQEIAAQLLVSPRTVGTHLSQAYHKLGVRSRRELSALVGPASPSR
ncbi:helix-turn-helix transcriptional regulator [Actinoplanes sp. OR16]|uniref:helix-turn-helix transcriptional regulator n=1 Tax=Actinoplanes sp. OR16 TaxID=946334 RepID=UPI000FD6CCE9|nr:helix-turn-helix transcriptional regulator [Actinoplanes sp. OR16]